MNQNFSASLSLLIERSTPIPNKEPQPKTEEKPKSPQNDASNTSSATNTATHTNIPVGFSPSNTMTNPAYIFLGDQGEIKIQKPLEIEVKEYTTTQYIQEYLRYVTPVINAKFTNDYDKKVFLLNKLTSEMQGQLYQEVVDNSIIFDKFIEIVQ